VFFGTRRAELVLAPMTYSLGVTAALVAWQLVGMTDLIVGVGTGTTARFPKPHGASMVAMTVLPLSLVPTFLVPLFMIFHVICIAQARSWKSVVENREQAAGSAGAVSGALTGYHGL
jgi:hypothetical protein